MAKPKPTGPKIREYFKEFVNRNHMLYCLHSNKKPTLFYKNKLSILAKQSKAIKSHPSWNEAEKKVALTALGTEMRKTIFGEADLHPSMVATFDGHAADWIVRFSHTKVDKLYKTSCPIDKSFFPLKKEIETFIKLKECDEKKISDFLSYLVKLDNPAVERHAIRVAVR